jgi:hypothetical protein
MSGFWILPLRISMARRMVSSRSHAPGPPSTVVRYGSNASLISHAAEHLTGIKDVEDAELNLIVDFAGFGTTTAAVIKAVTV